MHRTEDFQNKKVLKIRLIKGTFIVKKESPNWATRKRQEIFLKQRYKQLKNVFRFQYI